MSTVTTAVDLAKNVFEIAGANAAGRIVERRRMSPLSSSASGRTARAGPGGDGGVRERPLLGPAADRSGV